ncbi:MAG: hypothetical protein U1F43_04635 [Myxococcota bacterium]
MTTTAPPRSTPAPPTEVLVPRALAAYRCERTLMCCRAPYDAPVSAADEATLRARLDESEAGRTLAAGLTETLEPTPGRGERRFAKPYGSCLHLKEPVTGAGDVRACRLHDAAGLEALPGGCRNFPRVVQDVGDAGGERRWEVAFSLSCPTAARLVTEDPAPYSLVSLPVSEWPWRPQARRDESPERTALRDRWMALLGAVRRDPEPLLMAIGAMLERPTDPPEIYELAELAPAVGAPCETVAALVLSDQLFLLPARGRTYEGERDALLVELVAHWPLERFPSAVEAMPELLAAFVEHQLQALVQRPAADAARLVRLIARRALMIVRIVDGLCDRVPFRSKTLFADAYVAVAQLDPDAEKEPYAGATIG